MCVFVCVCVCVCVCVSVCVCVLEEKSIYGHLSVGGLFVSSHMCGIMARLRALSLSLSLSPIPFFSKFLNNSSVGIGD